MLRGEGFVGAAGMQPVMGGRWGQGDPPHAGWKGIVMGAEVWGPKAVGQGLWGESRVGSDVPLSPGQSFNTYFSNEHSRLLALWRQVVAFRRHFGEMKATTERSAGSPGGWWRRGLS